MTSRLLACSLLCASLFAAPVWAATVARVTHLSGVLTARHADGTTKVLAVKSEVQEGDLLITAQETFARIKFIDNAEVVLRPGTRLSVEDYMFEEEAPQKDKVVLNVLKGGLRAVSGALGKRNREAVSIVTPTATIGIRGTHFGVLMCQDDCIDVQTATGRPPENGLHLDVTEGAIAATNPSGSQVIGTGQFGFVRDLNTPPVLLPPQQSIQVTMPTSISRNDGNGRGVGRANDNQCAAQ
ncbi:FecR family protein [Noviherbaspirillum humi]|uniref:FecR family protein n=1 Tax=Noviherbaspirillum humi TaxID=1688639 RepID=A0A239J2V9_9BURK|nr:FecR domain-containing protein [Noviherbaspirillum humi]SNS99603.1 FecR family protein [Noviherbaspirillum humi]